MTKEFPGSIPAASNIFFSRKLGILNLFGVRAPRKRLKDKNNLINAVIISLKSKVLGQINLYRYVSEQTKAKLIQLLMLDVYA